MAQHQYLSPDEFDVIASLIRCHGAARDAARRVLVDGLRNADAAHEAGLKPKRVFDTAKRVRLAADRVRAVFSPASNAERTHGLE